MTAINRESTISLKLSVAVLTQATLRQAGLPLLMASSSEHRPISELSMVELAFKGVRKGERLKRKGQLDADGKAMLEEMHRITQTYEHRQMDLENSYSKAKRAELIMEQCEHSYMSWAEEDTRRSWQKIQQLDEDQHSLNESTVKRHSILKQL